MSAKDWFERGIHCKRTGDSVGALNAFRHSIKLNSRVAAPWIGLGQLLDTNSQFDDARECFKHATQAEPNHLMARIKLANSHKNLGYVEQSEQEYKHALNIDPNSEAAYFGLGQLYEDLGQPERAATAYRQVLTLDPSKKEALASLLGLSRHLNINQEIIQAENELERLPLREKALVGYGLGKAYDQQKQYDNAFNAYSIANSARKELAGSFNRKAFDARIEKMIELFSRNFFEARKAWGNPSQQPVFIVGLPRSGTTLTEQIISSHPSCFGAGELNVLTDLATGTPDRLGNANTSWPFCAPDLNETQIASLAQEYLEQSQLRAPENTSRVVDKQPLNFWHLGLIAIALPNARIIHCKRDIRDCGFSIFSQNFNVQQHWSTDLDDIAYYWQGYKRLMQHWSSVTNLKIVDLDYEYTVSNLNSSATSLLEFLDLPWDEQVLSFHENERAVQTPSRWQVRQPVYKSSMARWQRYESHIEPLIKAAVKSS